ERAEGANNFVIAQMVRGQEMHGSAKLPSMSASSPYQVGVPLKVSIIVALLARHLSAYINGHIQQRMCPRSGPNINPDWSGRAAGPRNIFLRRNYVWPFWTHRIAVTHPAKAERATQL